MTFVKALDKGLSWVFGYPFEIAELGISGFEKSKFGGPENMERLVQSEQNTKSKYNIRERHKEVRDQVSLARRGAGIRKFPP
jgi:hypothetical protein